MQIHGLQKLSLLDYPEKTAATVFTAGCNMRCPFCHNSALVTRSYECPEIPAEDFFEFLEKRRGKLDGVCISGGEPLMQPGLDDFIMRIRDMGFLVKLDTNGGYPERLRSLIDRGLLDYAAMDIKNSPEKYALTCGVKGFDIKPVLESAALLMENRIPYEFRTTAVKGLHDIQDMTDIGKWLAGAKKYYLQNFSDSGDLLGFVSGGRTCEMAPFTREELEAFVRALSPFLEDITIRG